MTKGVRTFSLSHFGMQAPDPAPCLCVAACLPESACSCLIIPRWRHAAGIHSIRRLFVLLCSCPAWNLMSPIHALAPS